LTLIWRPETIICNMASGSLIGKSIFDLVSATNLEAKVGRRSSFGALDGPVIANMASREHYLEYGVRIVDGTIY